MYFLEKYGAATHIYIPIIKRAAVDFAVGADWTPAAGDVKISKDGGAAANVTNLPAAITMGNTAMWDFSLTATELQAAKIKVTVADSATKAVEDQFFTIGTFGHASAHMAVDLDDAVRAGLTALPNAAAEAAGGLYTRGSGAGQVNQNANGQLDSRWVAGNVTVGTNSDKTGYTLSAAGVQAIWDALVSALTTVGSIGKKLADFVLGNDNKVVLSNNAHTGAVVPTVTTLTGHTPQTGDAFARLGAPAGASHAADIAEVKERTENLPDDPASQTLVDAAALAILTDTTDIKNKTNTLPADPASQAAVLAKLPAALVDGRMAAIAQVVGDKTGYALTADERAAIADRLLGRTRAGGGDGGRTVAQCLALGRNRWDVTPTGPGVGLLTVYADDDSTPLWTADVTLAAGDPVTGVDPT